MLSRVVLSFVLSGLGARGVVKVRAGVRTVPEIWISPGPTLRATAVNSLKWSAPTRR